MRRGIGYWSLGILGAGLLAVAYTVGSQDPGEPRVATVKDIMSGVQQPTMKRLTAAAKSAPADDKGWDELRGSAAVLNETGFILIEAGRAKDDVWTKAAADLRAAAAAIVKAAESKDFEAARAGIPKVAMTCKTCHDAHK